MLLHPTMDEVVLFQITPFSKRLSALFTFVWLYSGMHTQEVSLHVAFCSKCLRTSFTFVLRDATVQTLVCFQTALLRKRLPTVVTPVWFDTGVNTQVDRQTSSLMKYLSAIRATVRFPAGMNTTVECQIRLFKKHLPTVVTPVTFLSRFSVWLDEHCVSVRCTFARAIIRAIMKSDGIWTFTN